MAEMEDKVLTVVSIPSKSYKILFSTTSRDHINSSKCAVARQFRICFEILALGV